MAQSIINTTSLSQQNVVGGLALGILLAILGYFFLALINVSGKALAEVPVSILVFFQFFIGLLFSLPAGLSKGFSGLKTAHIDLILVRTIGGLLNISAIFLSLRYIPLVDATVLQNTAPLFLPLILWVVFKKSVPKSIWMALGVGFVGVLFIVKPAVNSLNMGGLFGLAAGFLSAVSMFSVSLLKRKGVSTRHISFYLFLIGTIAVLPFVIMNYKIIFILNLHQWGLLIFLGFLTYVCQTILASAFARGSAHLLGALSYITVVFSGLLDWIIWQHVPDWISIVGIAIVVLSGILTIVGEK